MIGKIVFSIRENKQEMLCYWLKLLGGKELDK